MNINDIPIAILIVQRDGKIIFANKQCHVIFDYEEDELIGRNFNILIPSEKHEKHNEESDKFWKNPYVKQLGIGRDLQGVTKNNTLIHLEIGLYPFKESEKDYIMAIIVDTTIRHVKEINKNLKNLTVKLEEIIKEIN